MSHHQGASEPQILLFPQAFISQSQKWICKGYIKTNDILLLTVQASKVILTRGSKIYPIKEAGACHLC